MRTIDEIVEIVKEEGMQKILEGAIQAIPREDDEPLYIEDLRVGLERVLYHYEHRYES